MEPQAYTIDASVFEASQHSATALYSAIPKRQIACQEEFTGKAEESLRGKDVDGLGPIGLLVVGWIGRVVGNDY